MKICISCDENKNLTEFYKHKGMLDGFLNKCKTCCKKQQKQRIEILRDDPEWVESERLRGKEKYKRLNYKNRKSSLLNKVINKSKYRNLSRDLKIPKDCEAHHWSYNEGHEHDIFIVKKSLHKILHTYLIFDENTNMFRTKDTLDLLDTREKHFQYFLNKGYKI